MRALAIAIAYAAPFLIIAVVPLNFMGLFLSVYFTAILGSQTLTLRRGKPDGIRSSNMQKGLAGAIFGALLLALYLESVLGLSPLNASKIVEIIAATWILFSLMLMTGSLVSVSSLGSLLVKGGLDGLKAKEEFPSGAQHFALEFCTLHWFRHIKYLLFALAITGMYLYGWFLLGLPYLLYSMPLLIASLVVQNSLARRFLAPVTTSEIFAQIEQKRRQRPREET